MQHQVVKCAADFHQFLRKQLAHCTMTPSFIQTKPWEIIIICKVWKEKGENPMFIENRGYSKRNRVKSWQREKRQNCKMHQFWVHFEFHHIHFAFLSCAPFHIKEDYKRKNMLWCLHFFVEEASKFEREGLKWLQKEINAFLVPRR